MERRNSITEKLYDAFRPMSEEKTKIAQALQDFIDEADDGGLTADETQKVLAWCAHCGRKCRAPAGWNVGDTASGMTLRP